MHYTKRQCSRPAIEGSDFCKVHATMSKHTWLEKLDWHEFTEQKSDAKGE